MIDRVWRALKSFKRGIMKQVNIILGFRNTEKLQKRDFRDKLVSLWTRSKYCHIKVFFDQICIQATLDGVKISEVTYKDLHDEEYDYVNINNIMMTIDQYHQILRFFDYIKGAKYDWMQIIFTHFIKLNEDHLSKWTCSELATKILQLCFVENVLFLRASATTPKDLAKIFGLE